MKKSLNFFMLIMFIFIFTSCGKTNEKTPQKENIETSTQQHLNDSKSKDKDKGYNASISVISDKFNNASLTNLNIKNMIISIQGVRSPKSPYNTFHKLLNKNEHNISSIGTSHNYIIEITSGPGFSQDGKINTLFTNKTEAFYFAKMTKEIVRRHANDKNFQGISISINNPDIVEKSYYSTLNYIISKIRIDYPDINIIYNLHPLSFETNYKNLPKINLKNVTICSEIYLKGISYPGYGAGYKSSIALDRNSILRSMKKLKDMQDETGYKTIINVHIPWADSSNIMLQDIFEISRTLGFNLNICYLNSGDIYDFSKNSDITQIIKRHN